MCLYIRYNRLTQNSNPTTQVKPALRFNLMFKRINQHRNEHCYWEFPYPLLSD